MFLILSHQEACLRTLVHPNMFISGPPSGGRQAATPGHLESQERKPVGAMMEIMAKIPDSTQTSLRQKLLARAAERWPQIQALHTRYRAGFAYIDATLTDGDQIKLCRLRYAGSASHWGFAIYRASHNDYQQAALPNGWPSGTPEEALDTACGLYLGDPTAWT